MKLLSLVLVLICLFLLTEGAQVTKIKKRGNVNAVSDSKLVNLMETLEKKLNRILRNTVFSLTTFCCKKVPKNCAEVLKCGGKENGIYTVKPDNKGMFKVYCDQKTNGGGWTVIQKRKDGSVNFNRGWNSYKNGFGHLKGEFWLGLDKIYRLTHQTRNRLRVELEDTKGKSSYAGYNYFALSSERSKYSLSLGTYSGTAGDSLSYHRGMAFSTKDRDNDRTGGHCASYYKGGWWFKACHYSNLNGVYHHGKHSNTWQGVVWYAWKGRNYSAKRSEMKIRPL